MPLKKSFAVFPSELKHACFIQALESIKGESAAAAAARLMPEVAPSDDEDQSPKPSNQPTRRLEREKQIQANRRKWALRESEGFFAKIDRLMRKAADEMEQEEEKIMKFFNPENMDSAHQILAEMDDALLKSTLENAVHNNFKTRLDLVSLITTCADCGKSFTQAQHYIQHLLNHVGQSLSQKKFLKNHSAFTDEEADDFLKQKFVTHSW